MNKLQKFLSVLLAAMLLMTCAPLSVLAEEEFEDFDAMGETDGAATELSEEDLAAMEAEVEKLKEGELIVAHPTITKGDFFTEMFGNNTADIDVRALIHGYNLVNWDQNQGTYVFDPSIVREVQVSSNDEGYKQYTMVLADNLYYSNGQKITAWDYAFSILLMMSPEVEAIGGKIYRAEHLAGYDDYIAARRKVIAGEPLNTVDDIDYLSGVTVLDDYQLRIWLDPDFLPYFFEIGLLMTVPYPIDVIAPGCKVVAGYTDADGNSLGIRIIDADSTEDHPTYNNYTSDLLKKTILDPETGYNTFPSVVSGPYVIKSWDGVTGHFEINPYFKGAWMVNNLPGGGLYEAWEKARAQGKIVQDIEEATGLPALDSNGNEIELVLPSIERIAFTVADNDTIIEEIENGEKHLVNKVTYKETVDAGLASALDRDNYPRIGLSFLTFTYDWPTVHDKEVRQAIAWCMDRDLLTSEYCGGRGIRVDGYFGLEQWEYQLLIGAIGYPINFLATEDEIGTKIMTDEDEEELKKKNMYRWYTTEAEKEAYTILWDKLREYWNGLLTVYSVGAEKEGLDKANELLDGAGWTLNRNGETYQPGVDDVRAKMIDGQLVVLDLKMMYPEGNHMAEFMQEEDNFVDNLAQVGIKLTLVPTPMQDLLYSYYRVTERTTDMIYLATNFHVIVDPSITYSTDETVGHEVWNNTYSDDERLFDLAVDMRKTEPGDYYTYVKKWIDFQERYNEILPTIPIYSNIYYDFFTPYLQNYEITAQVTWSQAILLAYFGLPESAMPAEEPELAEGEMVFD